MISAAPAKEDPTLYPVEERVGEDIVQRWIVELLRPLVQRWLGARGEHAFVGADQFIYFEQYNAHRRVSPDVYVLPGVSPCTHVRSWKVWEQGIVPSFALEVVSTNWEKDYCDAPLEYQRLGVRELIVFDPSFDSRPSGVRFQRYRRMSPETLELVEKTNGLVVESEVLGCHLRVVGEGSAQRLRIVESRSSLELFPTAEEAERNAKEVERAAKEAERRAKEAERGAKEAERRAKEAALARIAELEAELKERASDAK
jgi:Uma2 family endonuclease